MSDQGPFELFERHGESRRRIMQGESIEEMFEKIGEKAGVRFDPGWVVRADWPEEDE